jgi:hypothetical protein
MAPDTLAALTVVNQRLAVLEAGATASQSASTVAQIQANAAAVSNAEELQVVQQQALLASQARAAAVAALYHANYTPPPGWRPGMPYPLHG